MNRRWVPWIGLLLVGAGVLLILAAWFAPRRFFQSPSTPTAEPSTPTYTSTPEPIVPTRTPTTEPGTPTRTPTRELVTSSSQPSPSPEVVDPTLTATAPGETETPLATGTANAAPSPSPGGEATADGPAVDVPYRGRPRWGATVSIGPISRYDTSSLRLGWYLNWATDPTPPSADGAEYAQMVRLEGGRLKPDASVIGSVARARPGSLWLIGNEPDVAWQDNVEPAVYARLYHQAYSAIKGADPTARVAIGGVTQPTPLRLRYLERVLASYEGQFGTEMPVDVWNVHNFILREERGAWGVGIPPGLPDQQGVLYEIGDGDDMAIFRRQIVDFRRWMAERGYQEKPLIVSEYGILMPADYGFPPERVLAFLTATFDFFLTAKDRGLGYPQDDYRLVQRWCWFSLDAAEGSYPTGRLFDPQTGAMTTVGMGWERYVRARETESGP